MHFRLSPILITWVICVKLCLYTSYSNSRSLEMVKSDLDLTNFKPNVQPSLTYIQQRSIYPSKFGQMDWSRTDEKFFQIRIQFGRFCGSTICLMPSASRDATTEPHQSAWSFNRTRFLFNLWPKLIDEIRDLWTKTGPKKHLRTRTVKFEWKNFTRLEKTRHPLDFWNFKILFDSNWFKLLVKIPK